MKVSSVAIGLLVVLPAACSYALDLPLDPAHPQLLDKPFSCGREPVPSAVQLLLRPTWIENAPRRAGHNSQSRSVNRRHVRTPIAQGSRFTSVDRT